jgi:hypothetical protein
MERPTAIANIAAMNQGKSDWMARVPATDRPNAIRTASTTPQVSSAPRRVIRSLVGLQRRPPPRARNGERPLRSPRSSSSRARAPVRAADPGPRSHWCRSPQPSRGTRQTRRTPDETSWCLRAYHGELARAVMPRVTVGVQSAPSTDDLMLSDGGAEPRNLPIKEGDVHGNRGRRSAAERTGFDQP